MDASLLPKWKNPSPKEIAFGQSMQTVAQLLSQEQTPPNWIREAFTHLSWGLGSTWSIETNQKTRKASFQWAMG